MKMLFKTFGGGAEYTSDKIIRALTLEELTGTIELIRGCCLNPEINQTFYDHALILDKLSNARFKTINGIK